MRPVSVQTTELVMTGQDRTWWYRRGYLRWLHDSTHSDSSTQ